MKWNFLEEFYHIINIRLFNSSTDMNSSQSHPNTVTRVPLWSGFSEPTWHSWSCSVRMIPLYRYVFIPLFSFSVRRLYCLIFRLYCVLQTSIDLFTERRFSGPSSTKLKLSVTQYQLHSHQNFVGKYLCSVAKGKVNQRIKATGPPGGFCRREHSYMLPVCLPRRLGKKLLTVQMSVWWFSTWNTKLI